MNNEVLQVKCFINDTFSQLLLWFDEADPLLHHQPLNKGWTIAGILEHLSLTNHYLLILIRKGVTKSLEKAAANGFNEVQKDYRIDWDKLSNIGKHGSFEWNRPAHMEPMNKLTVQEIKEKLLNQLQECNALLFQIQNGEGVLHETTMTVNQLGKIDVYHYCCFLALHIQRHLTQMKKIKNEYTHGLYQ